ncbi:MAG: hypothetical protein RLZZ190_324 [Actinomycetota bacterium]|jgi:hypothetical protein
MSIVASFTREPEGGAMRTVEISVLVSATLFPAR